MVPRQKDAVMWRKDGYETDIKLADDDLIPAETYITHLKPVQRYVSFDEVVAAAVLLDR